MSRVKKSGKTNDAIITFFVIACEKAESAMANATRANSPLSTDRLLILQWTRRTSSYLIPGIFFEKLKNIYVGFFSINWWYNVIKMFCQWCNTILSTLTHLQRFYLSLSEFSSKMLILIFLLWYKSAQTMVYVQIYTNIQ